MQDTAGFQFSRSPENSGSGGGEGGLFDDEGPNGTGFCVGGRVPDSSSFVNYSGFRVDAPFMLLILSGRPAHVGRAPDGNGVELIEASLSGPGQRKEGNN